MVKLLKVALTVALSVIGATGADAVRPLIVTGDGVCLRARADGESEVVCQVSSGTVLQAVGDGSNWVEVLAPREASVWIAADLVSNGVVQVSRANVRAGPGINYPSVGTAQKNDKVDVCGVSPGWVRITPPSSCRLWISRSYVKSAPEKKSVEVRQPFPQAQVVVEHTPPAVKPHHPSQDVQQVIASATVSQTAVKATALSEERSPTNRTPVVLPAALKKYEPDPNADQGRQALYRGVMEKCNWLMRRPAQYRLVAKHPRRGIVTLCWVSGDTVLLAGLDGKRVSLSGREYRLKDVERPVVVYESVREDAANLTGAGIEPILQ